MSKNPFKGRIRGTLKPSFTTSSAHLFAKRGDEWMTEREKDREFPLRRSIPSEPQYSPAQERANQIRRDMKAARRADRLKYKGDELERAVNRGDYTQVVQLMNEMQAINEASGQDSVDMRPPQVHVHVNPDLDMFTKAERAKPKEKFVDPPSNRHEIKSDAQRKAAAIMLSMRRDMRPKESHERQPRPHKVKGSFYRFPDVIEPIRGEVKHKAAPFYGRDHPTDCECQTCERKRKRSKNNK